MVEALSRDAATRMVVRSLGLETGDFESTEVLTASLRRAASFACPTTRTQLVRSVTETIEYLVSDLDSTREQLDDLVQALVALGDLVEAPDSGGQASSGLLLFLGPPSFIRRRSGALLLLGIRPESEPLVGEDFPWQIRSERHLRYVFPAGEDVVEALEDYGLRQVPEGHWLQPPGQLRAVDLVRDYDRHLATAGPSGEILDLRLLDPRSPVTYYRSRWRTPVPSDHGNFVARRPQAFGADLWCYVAVEGGTPRRLVDLPINPASASGFDEAWRLQAAIDSERGHPQIIRVEPVSSPEGSVAIKLLAPPPRWLQRRWDILGSVQSLPGAIVSYVFSGADVEEEIDFAQQTMWLDAER